MRRSGEEEKDDEGEEKDDEGEEKDRGRMTEERKARRRTEELPTSAW